VGRYGRFPNLEPGGGESYDFAIERAGMPGHLGNIGVGPHRTHPHLQLGYRLDAAHEGQGLASDAVRITRT